MMGRFFGWLGLHAAVFVRWCLPDDMDAEDTLTMVNFIFGPKISEEVAISVFTVEPDESDEAMEMKEEWGLDTDYLPIRMLN